MVLFALTTEATGAVHYISRVGGIYDLVTHAFQNPADIQNNLDCAKFGTGST